MKYYRLELSPGGVGEIELAQIVEILKYVPVIGQLFSYLLGIS